MITRPVCPRSIIKGIFSKLHLMHLASVYPNEESGHPTEVPETARAVSPRGRSVWMGVSK